jgi:hypothetical protein
VRNASLSVRARNMDGFVMFMRMVKIFVEFECGVKVGFIGRLALTLVHRQLFEQELCGLFVSHSGILNEKNVIKQAVKLNKLNM